MTAKSNFIKVNQSFALLSDSYTCSLYTRLHKDIYIYNSSQLNFENTANDDDEPSAARSRISSDDDADDSDGGNNKTDAPTTQDLFGEEVSSDEEPQEKVCFVLCVHTF